MLLGAIDGPISEPDAACDSIRQPVPSLDRDVRPWQDVMVELAGRLGFPSFVNSEGKPKYEVDTYPHIKTVNFSMSCMHCEDADCVTICPTGAPYRRPEDGIVLIDQDKCMGCNLCSWACPYDARELDIDLGGMEKCTLCVDRIYDEALHEEDRQPACVMVCPTKARLFSDFHDPDSDVSRVTRDCGGYPLMPELGYSPVNRYLPTRNAPEFEIQESENTPSPDKDQATVYAGGWLNRIINL